MKIIILKGSLKEVHIEKINRIAADIGAEVCYIKNENEVPAEFADAEIVYGFGINIAKNNKNLKWLCVPSAGVDFLMKPGAFANEDCILTNSSGAYGVTIAEHIIAVSLMMMRKLTLTFEETLRGEWGLPKPQKSLKSCSITALGTGDIGSSFAKRVRAFEPKSLIGVNRSGQCLEPSFDRVVKIDELDKVLPETELCVMSLPSTSETKGILSRKRLELLPEGAYIVNVGRGSAIDEDALADLLDSGHLAGAALDVFQREPLPAESRLWKTKNLLITPHVAGNFSLDYTLDRSVDLFCEDLTNYAEKRPLQNYVDRKIGY